MRDYHGFDQIIAGELNLGDFHPRFHSYAKRIRHVDYDVTTDFSDVDPSTWLRLSHLKGALLPNLSSFKLSYTNPSTIGKERSLLLLPALVRQASITSFTFNTKSVVGYNARHEMGPIWTLLSDYKHEIETLVASGTFINRYTNIIATMQTLRSISLELALDSVLPDTLTALASLPRLSALSLVFSGVTPDPARMSLHSFHYLVNIRLRGKITFISRTLASMKANRLEHIDAQVVSGAGDGTQESVFPSLQLSRFPTIRRVFVDLIGCNPPLRRGERDNKVGFVAPMLGNLHVEELVVTSLDPSMCFSDYEIADLATAWPLLKILRLEHTSSPATQPTFASLDHLARRCSHLTELSITVQEGEFQHNSNVRRKFMSILQELNLQHTRIKRHARAARYIDELFPFLENFVMSEQQACETMRDTIFEACQLVRKTERMRKWVDNNVESNDGRF